MGRNENILVDSIAGKTARLQAGSFLRRGREEIFV
jgi:hypothetical protein